jgi:hypothetical protein
MACTWADQPWTRPVDGPLASVTAIDGVNGSSRVMWKRQWVQGRPGVMERERPGRSRVTVASVALV